jgi:hypothetical protein
MVSVTLRVSSFLLKETQRLGGPQSHSGRWVGWSGVEIQAPICEHPHPNRSYYTIEHYTVPMSITYQVQYGNTKPNLIEIGPTSSGMKWNKQQKVCLKHVHNGLLQDKKWSWQQNIFHTIIIIMIHCWLQRKRCKQTVTREKYSGNNARLLQKVFFIFLLTPLCLLLSLVYSSD